MHCGKFSSFGASFLFNQSIHLLHIPPLAANSCRFGFILRYPKGKEDITGIEYEPWHFRYVGKTAAPVIMEQGITLEEF